MARKSKRDKDPNPVIRKYLADNVAALRDKQFSTRLSVTARNNALAKESKTTLSQIQRVLSAELGTSIDLIARMAHALKVRPQDLLTPYFAVQPRQTSKSDVLPELLKPRKAG